MTNSLYSIGLLGKPHSLKGYQYINIEYFFREFDLKDISLTISGEKFLVEDFKKHLKNRNLIKFVGYDSIESISQLRNQAVYLTTEYKNVLLNKEDLPWIGFFVNTQVNNGLDLIESYSIIEGVYFCKLKEFKSFEIPYNKDFFSFVEGSLEVNFDKLVN